MRTSDFLNIVVPMAGAGSRFSKVGYKVPKPLIPVINTPMIKLVIENLRPSIDHRFIFICRREHIEDYELDVKLSEWAPGCKILIVDRLTEGAACTALLAENYINNDSRLMIANCDQYIDFNINEYLSKEIDASLSGLIMTMVDDDPKWSFVELNDQNYVTRVVEKEVISNDATVGIYNFVEGRLFVDAAKSMIDQNKRVNGEFYVAPTYNELISKSMKIGIYSVGAVNEKMFGLGTPEDLSAFEREYVHKIKGLKQ